MRCNVITETTKTGRGTSFVDGSSEVKLFDSEATLTVGGEVKERLVNARVVQIGDEWIAIEGVSADVNERRRWWCEVGAEKPWHRH